MNGSIRSLTLSGGGSICCEWQKREETWCRIPQLLGGDAHKRTAASLMLRAPWSSTRRKPWTPITHWRVPRKLAAQRFKPRSGTYQRGRSVAPLCRPRLTGICVCHSWITEKWHKLNGQRITGIFWFMRQDVIESLSGRKVTVFSHESSWERVPLAFPLASPASILNKVSRWRSSDGEPIGGVFLCPYKQEENGKWKQLFA